MDEDPVVGRREALAAGATAVTAGLAGCLAQGDNSGASDQIIMDGSDTVLPHGAAVAEEYQWRNPEAVISVRGSGTGAGFQRFCNGETEFQNASRQITTPETVGAGETSEQEQCTAAGVGYIELPALLDGIAVYKHPDNDWCECLTTAELQAIWDRNSAIETWSDVRPESEWPDEQIVLYGRDSASGTFDYFTEAITGEQGRIRDDYSGTPDTNAIVRGVSGNVHALGFGGAGFYFENQADLGLVAVDDGDGCVRPSPETIESFTYRPLSRPMYVYVRKAALARETVASIAQFYFEPVDEEARETGVQLGFMSPGEELTWTQWAARRVGYYALPAVSDRPELPDIQSTRARLQAAIEEVQTG